MSDELVTQLVEATGLSESAVRSVLWQTRRADWQIVRLRQGPRPCSYFHEITEEWRP